LDIRRIERKIQPSAKLSRRVENVVRPSAMLSRHVEKDDSAFGEAFSPR
jgi:hypothetical protein